MGESSAYLSSTHQFCQNFTFVNDGLVRNELHSEQLGGLLIKREFLRWKRPQGKGLRTLITAGFAGGKQAEKGHEPTCQDRAHVLSVCSVYGATRPDPLPSPPSQSSPIICVNVSQRHHPMIPTANSLINGIPHPFLQLSRQLPCRPNGQTNMTVIDIIACHPFSAWR